MKYLICLLLTIGYGWRASGQETPLTDSLPYHQIGDYPSNSSACAVIQRFLDGMGYRYYWATEGLEEADLQFKPSEDSRSSLETLEHIHSLSKLIITVIQGDTMVIGNTEENLSWPELRSETLRNIETASGVLKDLTDQEFFDYLVSFRRGDNSASYPIWHLFNGQISDAIYHIGQVVSNRRASGNPLDPRVNVFSGINK